MSRSILKVIALGPLCFVFIFANSIGAGIFEPTGKSNSDLARMKAVLDCVCKCGLTLAYCEKEDADCSERPALIGKLERLFDEGKRGMELALAFMGPVHPAKEQLIEARLQNRHAILFFYQKGCGECEDVKTVLKQGSEIWADQIIIAHVDIDKKSNASIRQDFGVYSTPTVLVVAPNGVVVRQFKENVTMEGLENAFVTPVTAEILRGLQDRRVIFLTVQAADWKNASSNNRTVSSVGEILRSSVRVLHLDPTDNGEEPLLKLLRVDDTQNQSLTYVVSQSGVIGSRFEGPVSRKDLFLAFQKVLAARTGCGGSGSGPGGNTCK